MPEATTTALAWRSMVTPEGVLVPTRKPPPIHSTEVTSTPVRTGSSKSWT